MKKPLEDLDNFSNTSKFLKKVNPLDKEIENKSKNIKNITDIYARSSLPLNATEQGIQNILKPSSDIAEGHVSKLKEDGTIEKTSVSGDSFLGQLLNRYAALYPQNTGNNLNNQNFVNELVKDIYFVIKNEHSNLLMAGYDLWESPEALRKILNDYTAMIMDPVSPGQQKTVVGFKDKVTGKVLNSMDLLNAIKPLLKERKTSGYIKNITDEMLDKFFKNS